MKWTINDNQLILLKGDITEMDTEAIVNAANKDLILGAGVAGAIRTKGGPTIQEECDRIGGAPVGGAAITTGGNLKAKHVIHAVGPRLGEGDEDKKLADATRNSMSLADKEGLTSIAFPAISTGIFGFPKERCAQIMLATVAEILKKEAITLKQVVFCLWGEETLEIFRKTAEELFPREDV
jgi:O-acetyl-ADP-ribose deacetylase (regulator of RNase III)